MSDFVQTMKDWRRMCRAYSTDDDDCCKGCPVLDYDNGCCEIYEMGATDWKKYENAIVKWAAEHPEPKYPTWVEWLMKCGVLMPTMDTDIVFSEDGKHLVTGVRFTLKAYEPMPADLAQKLGVEPKGEV